MRIPVLNPKSQGTCPVNLYYVQETDIGKPAMRRTPGLIEYKDFSMMQSIRGMCVMGNYLYAVVGRSLYRKLKDVSAWTLLGTITSYSGDCWIVGNGVQVMVVDSTDGWIYDAAADTISQITDEDFFDAISLAYHDGYFIAGDQNSDEWQCDLGILTMVSPYDVTNCFDASDYEAAKKAPGNIVGVVSALGQVWVFKEWSNQVYYNKGGSGFPFYQISGASNDVGLSAAHTLVELDNSLMWLDDKLMVRRAFSYNSSSVVSTSRMTEEFQQFSNVSDARAFSFNWHGNVFYVLTFPVEDVTYVYNCTTSIQESRDLKADVFWHRWSSWPNNGRHRANCYAYFEGKHLVGDFQNGKIYELGGYHDDGHIIRSELTYPIIDDGGKKQRHGLFRQEMKQGTGLINNSTDIDAGEDPKCYLQYSDDGAKTWSAEAWADMGKIGERLTITEWRRLGRTRRHGRTYRTIITDPVEVDIYGAEVT